MPIKLGVVMDPIESITTYKDSTYAMLLEAQARGWPLFYMEMNDLLLNDGQACAHTRSLTVFNDDQHWFEYGDAEFMSLGDLDVILMRKDPPFNMEYIYSTYILEQAERQGALVVNRPQALRDANEKLFTAWFPRCAPETRVCRRSSDLRDFLSEHGDIILKPLGGMGGASIFRVRQNDPNISVIMETISDHESLYVMAQRYIPEIKDGDKRILMVEGQPIPYALARIPAAGETRGNLAAGASGVGQALSERDQWIAQQVGPVLRDRGILFAGLDVIGDYLTEVNVTSPTCIRELDAQFDLNISAELFDAIERKLQQGGFNP